MNNIQPFLEYILCKTLQNEHSTANALPSPLNTALNHHQKKLLFGTNWNDYKDPQCHKHREKVSGGANHK